MKTLISKSFTNFTGTSLRLNQQEKLATSQCRCCGKQELDTFYIFKCNNRVMCKERNEVVDKLFQLMLNWEVKDKVKELIYQFLIDNKEYEPPCELSGIYKDM